MIKKAPPMFRRPIPEKTFENKIIKYIEIKDDREYLRLMFEPVNGFYTLKSELSKADAAKLKRLAKEIRANRAWSVRALPLVIVSAIVCAAAVFCLFFMNPLLEKALEGGLESVFEARVDVDNFVLNPLAFRIGISGITAADRDDPMKNLFQMGRAEIRLLPQAVLKGKIYIEEISAAEIRFGTPRTTSGALPAHPPKNAKPPAPEMPPLVDIANFDAMALVLREADSLNSKKLYDEAAALYDASLQTWKTRVDDSKNTIAGLRNSAKPFIEFNISGIDVRNPAAIQNVLALIEDGKRAADAINAAKEQAEAIADGLRDDIRNVDTLRKNAADAVKADIDRLKSYIDFSSGSYNGIILPVLRQILTDAAWRYIGYGNRALEALEKVKQVKTMVQSRQKAEKKERFNGRDVVFPSRQYPAFYIGILASDFTMRGWRSAFDLRNVSSDPEITGKPVLLKLSVEEAGKSGETGGGGRFVSFDGSADFRDSADELFKAELTGGGFPFSLGSGLRAAGIGGFGGRAGMRLAVSGLGDGSIFTSGTVNVTDPALSEPQGTVARAVAQAVSEADAIEVGFDYRRLVSGDTFSASTNIDNLVMAALKKMAAEYAGKAVAELEKAVRSYIGTEYLSDDDLNKLYAVAAGDRDAIDSLRTAVTDKLTAMEKLVRGEAEERLDAAKAAANEAAAAAAEQAKRQAEEQAQSAARNALQGLFGR